MDSRQEESRTRGLSGKRNNQVKNTAEKTMNWVAKGGPGRDKQDRTSGLGWIKIEAGAGAGWQGKAGLALGGLEDWTQDVLRRHS